MGGLRPGPKVLLPVTGFVRTLAVMRWTAVAVLLTSICGVARAQTSTTSPLSRDGGAPPALEDGGTASRPFSATPDGGVATFGPAQGAGSTQIERRNGVMYVGDGKISTVATDAGTTADNGAGEDGGTRSSSSSGDTEDLRRRIAVLEQRLGSANAQQQELQRLNEQISELRQQLAQIESQRTATQQQAVESRARTEQAVTTLYAAQQALTNGNSDVAATLSSVAASLPPPAQRELQAAQEALRANDLYAARTHISAAIAASRGH